MFKTNKNDQTVKTDLWDLSKPKSNKRIFELDFFRGIAIIIMALYHLSYDFAHLTNSSPFYGRIFSFFYPADLTTFIEPPFVQGMQSLGIDIFYNFIPSGGALQALFAILFMLICGISCTFSHDNYIRGIKLLFLGIIMSISLDLFSFYTNSDVHIYLGIIQSMAIGIIFYSVVNHFINDYKMDIFMTLILSIILTGVAVSEGNNGISVIKLGSGIQVDTFWENRYSLFLGYSRCGIDYFSPILTSTFIFLGGAIGKVFYKNRISPFPQDFPQWWARPILWCGKHSLLIYIIHQPLFIGILWAILAPFGYTCL